MIFLASCGFMAALVGGCPAADNAPPSEPKFYASVAKGGKVDPLTAQSMISGYRRNNGLNPIETDAGLMKIAEEHARNMAARGAVEHNLSGKKNFNERVRASGFDAKFAVENVGGGYHTLAEAFSGWRDSPSHRENMLRKGVTHMGIAAVHTPNSKYKVFWCLVLAAKDDQPKRQGPPPVAAKPKIGETTMTIR
ncbi:cysteine-rich secretory protein family protein [Variibacter gotjawalensis]|uniref:Cysteine-rich secretory protein family protein n=1 Tax=Variibacter gotjawalensis TaxID=1333996 RepID=A0A0S3PV42_9BRAD|nr:CAP domain-containing protein [Variibacter gotjawalensis]NIK50144.1 hypothetical protein [Variibacter gotjawalensis]RZS46141.1 cysteine-rich secretory family protein [Variibacter gotjawalensis]BAT59817.1 cysteine-rich secretory protein family protein [Variibacter gotjawalensis]